ARARVFAKRVAQPIGDLTKRRIRLNRVDDTRHQVLLGSCRLFDPVQRFEDSRFISPVANLLQSLYLLPLELRIEAKQRHRRFLVDGKSINAYDRFLARFNRALILVSSVLDLSLNISLLYRAQHPTNVVDLLDVLGCESLNFIRQMLDRIR